MNCKNCGRPMVHCWRYCGMRLIAALFMVGFASSLSAGGKPSLLLFTDPTNCPPCRLFDRDWGRDKAFRDAVSNAYAIVPSYQPKTHGDKFREYRIATVPTWVIVAGGSEINRVSGYTTPTDLWTRLRNATKNTPRARPPDSTTPPSAGSVPGRDGSVSEQIRQANRALEVERDELRAETERLKKQLLDAKKSDPKTPDQAPEIADLKKQIEQREAAAALAAKRLRAAEQVAANAAAEAERLRKQSRLPDAENWVQEHVDAASQPAPTPAPISRPSQPAVTTESTGNQWLSLLRSVGGGLLMIAAPQIAVPAGLALGAAGLAVRWRNQRRSAASTAGSTFPVSQPSLPRDNNEIEQILSLRQQEQREPIHDAFFGVLFEDEYRSNPDKPIREAWASALDRFNNVAPLSTRATTTTETVKG